MDNLNENNTNDELDFEKHVRDYIDKHIREYSENWPVEVETNSLYRRCYNMRITLNKYNEPVGVKPKKIFENIRYYDVAKQYLNCAELMYEGKIQFDKTIFLKALELMENDELVWLFAHDDYNHLLDDLEFVIEMIERSGVIFEIVSAIPDCTVKRILEDKEIMNRIYSITEIAEKFEGQEILAAFIVRLSDIDTIGNDKEYMMSLMKNLNEISEKNKKSTYMIECAMNYVLSNQDEKIFHEKDYAEAVFEFFDHMGGNLEFSDFDELSKKMLSNSELSLDKKLAYKYARLFSRVDNIDRSLFEDEELFEKLLDDSSIYWGNIELPEKYYSNPEILRKYLAGKDDCVSKINFDFDNELLRDMFLSQYGYSMDSCMRDEIKYAIENNKEIIIKGYDDSIDYDEIIGIIQQWAEDEDLIRIGDRIKIVNNPEDQVVKGRINIVTGENAKNTIIDGNDTTIILDARTLADTLKQIGIDTRVDMDKMQDLYNEMIEALKQRVGEEDAIMQQDVSEIIKGSNLLNHGQNHINIIVDEESDKVKAVLSIPHPVYRNEFQKVEFDGEELLEIIELANNNSPEESCSDIIQMLPGLGQRREKNQELVVLVQELATQKSELEAKSQDAKKLLEQYEELNGEKNKSVYDE